MNILVIAPHADDEVLGCGGTISRYAAEGHKIDLCITSKPHTPNWSEEYIRNREEEIKNVCKTLNINKVTVLDYKAALLGDVNHIDLNDKIRKVVEESNPDEIFIPFYGDLHKDHRVVAESCLVVLRPIEHKIRRILMYEILSETEWGYTPFKPNIYIDITNYINNKIEAMKHYKKEVKNTPHPRSIEGIKALARKRGSEVNIVYAESFILIREVI